MVTTLVHVRGWRVEGVVAVRLSYRQTAAHPLCWSFFRVAFFLLFLFFLFLRFLVILCSFLAAAVTILFLLPLHLVRRFYPHSDVPHYTTPPPRSALPSHESDSIPHSPPS